MAQSTVSTALPKRGRRLGDKVFRLTTRPTQRRPWFSRLGLLCEWQFDCTSDPTLLVEAWQRLAPDVLQGYPASLRSLAHHALETGNRLTPAPRLVFSDSALLPPDTRVLVEQAFGTRVIDVFGTFETDNIAFQCAAGDGYHIATDSVVLEIVRDGTPVPTGEEGEIVTAQLTLQTEKGAKEIDFLESIVGLHTDDVRKRAVALHLPNGSVVTVLHPLDVLASRLHNLAEIPEKRNDKGVAQAELAISIAAAFLRGTIAHRTERELFNQIERIKIIVTNDAIAAICRHYSLDVLSCVPIDQITNENFKAIRWPQIQRAVEFMVGAGAAAGAAGVSKEPKHPQPIRER